ncbi:potassium channel family protein [Methanosarcina siciliae]|uniref:potassium channel family protein n=1 Tax=Methanosarcina siciliae TaxID=38027 RepID=UPI001E3F6A6B|nr:potassium channel family protein [Methanosarcina siciliae]
MSCRKIIAFLFTVLSLTLISGVIVYFVEGKPAVLSTSVYWAITTLLTTGYGDTVLQTNFGRLVASVVKILGFSIIVVPIVIIIAEIFKSLSETSWKN